MPNVLKSKSTNPGRRRCLSHAVGSSYALTVSMVVLIGACKPTLGPASRSGSEDNVLTTTGTIRFIDVEGGGCWKIDTPHGAFELVNLPAGFRSNGAEVMVTLTKLVDQVTACQVGRVARIDSILKR